MIPPLLTQKAGKPVKISSIPEGAFRVHEVTSGPRQVVCHCQESLRQRYWCSHIEKLFDPAASQELASIVLRKPLIPIFKTPRLHMAIELQGVAPTQVWLTHLTGAHIRSIGYLSKLEEPFFFKTLRKLIIDYLLGIATSVPEVLACDQTTHVGSSEYVLNPNLQLRNIVADIADRVEYHMCRNCYIMKEMPTLE